MSNSPTLYCAHTFAPNVCHINYTFSTCVYTYIVPDTQWTAVLNDTSQENARLGHALTQANLVITGQLAQIAEQTQKIRELEKSDRAMDEKKVGSHDTARSTMHRTITS